MSILCNALSKNDQPCNLVTLRKMFTTYIFFHGYTCKLPIPRLDTEGCKYKGYNMRYLGLMSTSIFLAKLEPPIIPLKEAE